MTARVAGQLALPDVGGSSAVLSEDHVYRYRLDRIWHLAAGRVCWIMLNPSTADASADDPTIRRCVGFTKRWGYGGLVVVNLFGLRATDPKQLLTAEDPVGPRNPPYILSAANGADRVVCAWGTKGAFNRQNHDVASVLVKHDVSLWCLGTTRDGHPKHPLYVAADTELRPWGGYR